MTFWKRLLGDENASALKRATPIAARVSALESDIQTLSDDVLKAKTTEFKERLAAGLARGENAKEVLDDLAPEAFAVVREVSRRTLKQRHFDVQLIGGMILHNGDIAEMRTGEGKTLVATLPAYLNALVGKGVHVITVNDYLSRRDGVWMGQIYDALGMSVGILNHEASYVYDVAHVSSEEAAQEDAERDLTGGFKVMQDFLRPCTRPEAYAADITYGTNNEFGFDYLRDNLEYDAGKIRQKEHHFAIVDEIDSILIDEARTPLIISAPVADAGHWYQRFAAIAASLVLDDDYTVDEKHKQIALTDQGIERAEKALGIDNIYTDAGTKMVHHLETSVRAQSLYERDREYVVRGGEVIIIDEFTGRLQPGRRWSDGLHQAIEAKEGVAVQPESRTFASITFQNYFRLYEKLSGMTGTAVTSSEEFYKVYGLNTVVVPTNRAPRRIDHDDLIFQTENGKYTAIVQAVMERHGKGQPILIGTASVEKNELLSAYFSKNGIPHEVLNAKNHEREGEIIAQAGRLGAVTVATNLAGRGVDIKLGGNPALEKEESAVKNAGGLFVLATERHEARRIDNQLRGRSGRQGDPGETQFFVSLEDSLMRVFASDMIKRVMGTFKIPEDEPIQNSMITKSLEKAQTRIEELNFDARKHVLSYDDVLNIQRQSIYARRRILLEGGSEEIDTEISRIAESQDGVDQVIAQKRLEADESFYPAVRQALLQTIDYLWVDHLEAMEYLRNSVNLRAYGQRDPLVEYKKEGLQIFQTMEDTYAQQSVLAISNMGLKTAPLPEEAKVVHDAALRLTTTRDEGNIKTYGRNDRVTVTNGTEQREMKYKKASELIADGGWKIVE